MSGKNLRVLLTWRWALALIFVVLATFTCVRLGIWQLHRFEEKSARAAVIELHYDAKPIELSNAPASAASRLSASDDYTVVKARGRYCMEPTCVLYVRNRVSGSSVGFWQLVPFHTSEGQTLLVVRGWIETGQTDSVPATHPRVPDGEVDLVARLRPREPRLAERPEVKGQLHSVNATDVEAQVPELTNVLKGAYGEAVSENGAAPEGLAPLAKPETSTGPHLSYAFQWWIFSAFFVLGLVVSARRTVLDHSEGEKGRSDATHASVEPARHEPISTFGRSHRYGSARKGRRRSSGSDEDEEDLLLEERREG